MKKIFLFVFLPIIYFSQIPTGYYDSTVGLSGYKLKSALHDIISNKTIGWNYSDVVNFYNLTDVDKYYENDNTVLDIYSEIPTGPDAYEYNFTQNIGSANAEGLGWNKEHMMPQSTFYSNYPMQADLNFIVPTDARINQLRSNYPYGKAGATNYYTFSNTSKISKNATPNAVYTGRVYEPIDEFKGDIARSLLYFAVRYEGKLGSFKFETDPDPTKDRNPLNGTEEQVYDQSFLDLMLLWSANDPVSQREIDRNNAIYGIQKNRNPFIDHPEWVNLIWGQTKSTVAPQAASNLITSKVSAYFVNLNWTAPSDPSIIGYKVYQDGVLIGLAKSNSFTVDHLNPATNYNFTIKSYNNAYLESSESNLLPVLTYTSDVYAKDLIFTKYLEGSGDNKALEITNKTGHTVNLDGYSLSIQFKSSSSYYFPDPLQLEGKIADNDTFVVMNARAAFSCYTTEQSKFVSAAPSLTFDGSNYVELRYNYSTVDAVGTKDMNNFSNLGNTSLYRLSSVTQPNSNFDINEWQKNSNNYCVGLGTLDTSEISNKNLNNISIYPNPITESQIFANGNDIKKVNSAQVYDLSGKLIISEKNPFKNKNYIDVQNLEKGIYILKMDNQNFKIIKK
ncbi:endonuclease [Halpernia sp.]|uniref:endonuclease n=1 Tax=Halpernia sp. TaxID=2782209 RepID=UPI003A905616